MVLRSRSPDQTLGVVPSRRKPGCPCSLFSHERSLRAGACGRLPRAACVPLPQSPPAFPSCAPASAQPHRAHPGMRWSRVQIPQPAPAALRDCLRTSGPALPVPRVFFKRTASHVRKRVGVRVRAGRGSLWVAVSIGQPVEFQQAHQGLESRTWF